MSFRREGFVVEIKLDGKRRQGGGEERGEGKNMNKEKVKRWNSSTEKQQNADKV